MTTTVVLKDVHCCGNRDVKGMNSYEWDVEEFVKNIVTEAASFEKPHMGDTKYAGFAHLTLSYAYDADNKRGRRSKGQCNTRYTALRAYINKYELGELYIAPHANSPIYGGKHVIVSALWTPDNFQLMKHARDMEWVTDKPSKHSNHATVWV